MIIKTRVVKDPEWLNEDDAITLTSYKENDF